MKNYSILVIKKDFYLKYKKLPNEMKFRNALPMNQIQNDFNINKNIFSYCITIINDILTRHYIPLNYDKLISNEDSAYINKIFQKNFYTNNINNLCIYV